jgi:hypothetical protein
MSWRSSEFDLAQLITAPKLFPKWTSGPNVMSFLYSILKHSWLWLHISLSSVGRQSLTAGFASNQWAFGHMSWKFPGFYHTMAAIIVMPQNAPDNEIRNWRPLGGSHLGTPNEIVMDCATEKWWTVKPWSPAQLFVGHIRTYVYV